MPAGKSILMTPDPYHTPGYGGFCPQFKFQIGETFGRTTNHLLKDSWVVTSGKLVLKDIKPVRANSASSTRLLKKRVQGLGDQKLIEKMVPGYAGFIPKGQHYFGNSFSLSCRNAIEDFKEDQHAHEDKINEMKLTAALQTGSPLPQGNSVRLPDIHSRYLTPLQPIAREPKPFVSKHTSLPSMSPYYLDNDNPRKHFISGYSGFVPRNRGQVGMSFPVTTHLALNEFTDDLRSRSVPVSKSVNFARPATHLREGKPIYPKETGLVPHYTGHVPAGNRLRSHPNGLKTSNGWFVLFKLGELFSLSKTFSSWFTDVGQKFRHGNTFGYSTENALRNKLTI